MELFLCKINHSYGKYRRSSAHVMAEKEPFYVHSLRKPYLPQP